jgi:hypothetical protein
MWFANAATKSPRINIAKKTHAGASRMSLIEVAQ